MNNGRRRYPLEKVRLVRLYSRRFYLIRSSLGIKEVENARIHQTSSRGGMSVKEYSIKFTQLSKYAPTMAANFRDKMNKFSMGYSILW